MSVRYVTTPIYYVNDAPHIGHAYTTIVADVLCRYYRLFGDDVFFLTGTDEHGQKVQQAAKARGLEPQAHVDELVQRFQSLFTELGIKNDIFMRTTLPFHKKVVQDCLQQLFDKGQIYLHEYEGWYSVSEEIFYTDKDLVNGKSPLGKEVTKVVEKNYFFRMSKYQEQLIAHIQSHPNFIMPEGKKSEVLGFLRQPLEDLCISRPKSRLAWGVELPFDPEFVTYVWFDALLNYASAVGLKQSAKDSEFKKYWPNAVHLIGKDILTPHAIYWPTMLMALELPLPKTVFAHGWWLNEVGGKMSKSEGPVVSPFDMKDIVGVDPFRYYLVRDVVLGNDAKFSQRLMIEKINAELANNLGNLLSRTLNLTERNFGGVIPELSENNPGTSELKKAALAAGPKLREKIEMMHPSGAVEAVLDLLYAANKYIDDIAPWKTVKTDLKLAGECLAASIETLRIAAILLHPVMPSKMSALLDRIGWTKDPIFEDALSWGLIPKGTRVEKGEPLFPRLQAN